MADFSAILKKQKTDFQGEKKKVQVSEAAQEFVGKTTFAALTNHEVITEMFPDTPKAGFQFYVNGVVVTSAGGGDAAAAGFTVETGNNTVLSFSFSGDYIPAGSGVQGQHLFQYIFGIH